MATSTQKEIKEIKELTIAQKKHNDQLEYRNRLEKEFGRLKVKTNSNSAELRSSKSSNVAVPDIVSTPLSNVKDTAVNPNASLALNTGKSAKGWVGIGFEIADVAYNSYVDAYNGLQEEERTRLKQSFELFSHYYKNGVNNEQELSALKSSFNRLNTGLQQDFVNKLTQSMVDNVNAVPTSEPFKVIHLNGEISSESYAEQLKAQGLEHEILDENSVAVRFPLRASEIANNQHTASYSSFLLQKSHGESSLANEMKTRIDNLDLSDGTAFFNSNESTQDAENIDIQTGQAVVQIYREKCSCLAEYLKLRERERKEAERLEEIARRQSEVDQGRAQATGVVADHQFNQLSDFEKIDFEEAASIEAMERAKQREIAWNMEKAMMRGENFELELEQYKIYEDAKEAYTAQAEQKRSDLQRASIMSGISSMSTAMDGMMGIIEKAGGRQSSAYKTLFAMSKGFAVAEATLNLHVAVMKAFSAGQEPAEQFANIATALSQGVKLVAAVQSVTMSGQAHAGIDYIPREGTWLLDRGERVVDSRTNADLKQYLKQNNSGSSSGGSSISINIPLSVQGSDNGDNNSLANDANMLAGMIKSKVFEIISNEQRPGGILSRG